MIQFVAKKKIPPTANSLKIMGELPCMVRATALVNDEGNEGLYLRPVP